jgi:hypothetical protein
VPCSSSSSCAILDISDRAHAAEKGSELILRDVEREIADCEQEGTINGCMPHGVG